MNSALSSNDRRAAGAALVLATVFSLLVIAFHPSDGPNLAGMIARAEMAGAAETVHGILITLALCWLVALASFAADLGLHRGLVRTGLILYGVGVIALIAGALINGFVTTDVAGRLREGGADEALRQAIGQLLWAANQALIKFGTIAMSAGIASWAIEQIRGPLLVRLTGAVGLLASLAGVLVPMGWIGVDTVLGMTVVIAMQGAWYLAVGALLVARKA